MNTSEKTIGQWFIHSELKLISKCHKRRPLLQLVSYSLLHIRIAFYLWAWTKCNFKSSLMIPTFYAIFEKSGGKFVLHFAKRPKNLLHLQIWDMRLPITLPSYSLWGIDNILFARLSKPPSQIPPPPLPPTCLKQRHQYSEFAILGLHCSSTRPSPSQAKVHRKSFSYTAV